MAPETPQSKDFGADEERLVAEVTRKLTLLGGKPPNTADEFWRVTASALKVAAPHQAALPTAKAVLEHLGEAWDEDFAAGDNPSLAAYETLIDRLEHKDDDDSEDDADDAPTGELANAGRIQVSPMDLPIMTYVQYIDRGTLKLDPEWQRGYVWRASRRRKLIESLFLKLPIPPVLLFKNEEEKLFVIDGRQRLETVYRFGKGSADKKQSFSTFSKKTPGWKENEPLHEAAGKRYDKLPEQFKNLFDTSIINARIFENLERKKLYEIFKRYNIGGDKLNSAEIRNAVYQGVRLHVALYRLAGEGTERKDADATDKWVSSQLRNVMKKKTARYGAYNFIGRVLAFTHMSGGSVANAIMQFMDDHKDADPNPFRVEFAEALKSALAWYPNPLCADLGRTVQFHEWVATIQMVSCIKALAWIRDKRTTQAKVQDYIEANWGVFVDGRQDGDGEQFGGLLQAKQNTGAHWAKQREWIAALEGSVCVP